MTAQGHDGEPILVAVLASVAQKPNEEAADPGRFTVWTCTQLSASIDNDADRPKWAPCGWFDGTQVILVVYGIGQPIDP